MIDPQANLREQENIAREIARRTASGWLITDPDEAGLVYLERGSDRWGPATTSEAARERESLAHNHGEGLTAAERSRLLERLLELADWREDTKTADPALVPAAVAGWLEYTEGRLEALEVALTQLNERIAAEVPTDRQATVWEWQRAPVGAARHIGTGLSELRRALGNPPGPRPLRAVAVNVEVAE